MRDVRMHESTWKTILSACYAAYESGELSDEQYTSVMRTMRHGIPQSTTCKGQAFHLNPGHVCDPEE